jgi:hypothetical protein
MKVLVKVLCGLCVVLAPGCARDRTLDVTLLTRASIAAPQPPPLLTTPAALLLTNHAGFSSRLVVESPGYSTSGTLWAGNAKLRFLPDSEKRVKNIPEGRYSFLWDVATRQGWVLSDALQGYAPMTLSKMAEASSIRIEGVAGGDGRTIIAEMAGGKTLQFTAIPSGGSKGVPVEIKGGEPAFTAMLTKVNLAQPEAAMFEIPQGFTAYPSAEAMVDEMANRFRNLRKKTY